MKHIEIWRKHVDNMGIFYGIQFKSFDGVSGVFFSFNATIKGWVIFQFIRVSAVQLGSKAG
jgi:hypothetical protein